jgi:rhamnogalacturonan endolyase
VLTPTLGGAYQYFVNRALPQLGEFRTLWRLDNKTFTHGWTVEKNAMLPLLSEIHKEQKVQDETFARRDGGYVTKYDLASFLEAKEGIETLWGVYGVLPRGGEGVGSWYIHGGKAHSRILSRRRC